MDKTLDKNLRIAVRVAALMMGLLLCLGVLATSAVAKPPPVTKITFKLQDHNVPPGSPVVGSILVRTRANHEWVPFPNAPLSIRVDGTEVMTLVSGSDGRATVSYVAAEGGHVMKVVFAGDLTHKRAKRAQGFSVTAGATAVPGAPVLSATAGFAIVNLSWTTPSDGGSTILSYDVYRGTVSGQETILASGVVGNAYADLAVVSGTTYYYVVRAVNAEGAGPFSNEAPATPS